MEKSKALPGSVIYGKEGFEKLNLFIDTLKPSKIFVLVDTKTHEHCLPLFMGGLSTESEIEIIEIEEGEINKNIETCASVWEALSELGADRKSLLINLGGGVVTDLGGFVACTYKRGIPFVQVPTTLLAMVDAAIGGKNGVDLGALKNQVGLIHQPNMIWVEPEFLQTLPFEQIRSGFAEMLKHGLIRDRLYWEELTALKELKISTLAHFIRPSVNIKQSVVFEDPNETGLRKILNFGHTLGHAIESYFLTHPDKKTLLHGEAIAIGMVMETWLSHKCCGLKESIFQEIATCFTSLYDPVVFTNEDILAIINLLKHDKKNSHGKVLFVLLRDIGEAIIDIEVDNKLIINTFNKYNSLQKNQ